MDNYTIEARPWEPQDLLDDLQMYIDEEPDNYLNGRRTAMCMARDYLKEYFEHDRKWISVEERLPEIEQRVLVFCRSRMYKKHITVSTYTRDYSYIRRCYWSRRVKEVTHWMPLPEPPEV